MVDLGNIILDAKPVKKKSRSEKSDRHSEWT